MSAVCRKCKIPNNLVTCDECKELVCAPCARLTPGEVLILRDKERTLKFLCEYCTQDLSSLLVFKSRLAAATKKVNDLYEELHTNEKIIEHYVQDKPVIEKIIKDLMNRGVALNKAVWYGVQLGNDSITQAKFMEQEIPRLIDALKPLKIEKDDTLLRREIEGCKIIKAQLEEKLEMEILENKNLFKSVHQLKDTIKYLVFISHAGEGYR